MVQRHYASESTPSPSRKPPPKTPPQASHIPSKNSGEPTHPLFRLIPDSLYDPHTQKILGIFRAEELLLIALILLLLQDKKNENTLIVYALIYILLL